MGKLQKYYDESLKTLNQQLNALLDLLTKENRKGWSKELLAAHNELILPLQNALQQEGIHEKLIFANKIASNNYFSTFLPLYKKERGPKDHRPDSINYFESFLSSSKKEKVEKEHDTNDLFINLQNNCNDIETNLTRFTINDAQRIARLKDLFNISSDIDKQLRTWCESILIDPQYTNTIGKLTILFFEENEKIKDAVLQDATHQNREDIRHYEAELRKKTVRSNAFSRDIVDRNLTYFIGKLTKNATLTMEKLEDKSLTRYTMNDLYFKSLLQSDNPTRANIFLPLRNRWISRHIQETRTWPEAKQIMQGFLGDHLSDPNKELLQDIYEATDISACKSFTALDSLYIEIRNKLATVSDYLYLQYYAAPQANSGDNRSFPGRIANFILNVLKDLADYLVDDSKAKTMTSSNNVYIQTILKINEITRKDTAFFRQLLFIEQLSRMYFTSTGFASMLTGEKKLFEIDNFPSYFIIKKINEGDNTDEKHVIYLKKVGNNIHYIFTVNNKRVTGVIDREKLDSVIFESLLQNNQESNELYSINIQAAIFLYLSQQEGISTPMQYAYEIKDCNLSDVKILYFYRDILTQITTLNDQFSDFLSKPFPPSLLDKINELIDDLQELSTYELKKKGLQTTPRIPPLNMQHAMLYAGKATITSNSPRSSPRTLTASPLSPKTQGGTG